MIMFEKVLVGVDGASGGRDAIALASRLSDQDGNLTLAHVHPGRLHAPRSASPGTVIEESEKSLELLKRERSAAEVTAELVSVGSPSPGRGLHQQADELLADLLVVGSSSRSLLGRAMLGDDTRASLNGAPCAVAVAARGYAAHAKPIVSIGVGYDSSPESESALRAAKTLARAHRASVAALEVVAIPTYAYAGPIAPITGDTIDAMLREASGRMEALDGVDGRAVYGLAGEELAAFGDTVDLLIVGSRSYGAWRRLVLGSTSEYLARHARCSLLVLPRSAAPRS
jgi:nucleotide-binding universal stress UspA family protein